MVDPSLGRVRRGRELLGRVPWETPGAHPLRLTGEFFVSFSKIIRYPGMEERWKECMESCAVTRHFLLYYIPGGSYHGPPHYSCTQIS